MKTMPKTTSEEKYQWIKLILNKKIINHQIILQIFLLKRKNAHVQAKQSSPYGTHLELWIGRR